MARQAVKKTDEIDATKEQVEVVVTEDSTTETLKLLKQELEALKNELNLERQKTITVINSNDNGIDLNRVIKVTSLLDWTYNLTTKKHGLGGATYTFNGYGDTKPIRMKDMMDILSLYASQIEDCFAILETKKDYEDLGIGYVYDNMLTKDKMADIINNCTNEYVDIILSMGDEIQMSVLSQIAKNIVDGKNYDFNAIETLREHTDLQKYVDSYKADKE